MSATAGAQTVPETRCADGEWQPKIVALVCNWCTYTGADMAGTARRTYAPNVRVVRLLCSGRIDPLLILQAFEQGGGRGPCLRLPSGRLPLRAGQPLRAAPADGLQVAA